MDHPVSPSVKKLANTLLESGPTNWTEALGELNELSALTAATFESGIDAVPAIFESLENESKESESAEFSHSIPEPALAAPAPKAARPAVTVPEKYAGENLQDQKVLDALFSYHRMHAPVLGATTSPKPAKNSNRSVFSPMEIPIIEAAPKAKSAAKQPGSSGIASSILKPKK